MTKLYWAPHTCAIGIHILLEEIGNLVAEETRREKAWPKDATRLSGRLRRASPALRTRGIKIKFGRKHDEPLPGGRRPFHHHLERSQPWLHSPPLT